MEDNQVVAPEPPSRAHQIFMGPDGIRAGWSIGIFVIILAVLSIALMTPVRLFLHGTRPPAGGLGPIPMGVMEFLLFVALLGASIIMTRIEHKPVIYYGLEGTRRIPHFFYGLLFGFLALSALVGAMLLFGFLRFDGMQIFGWRAVKYALAWGGVFLLVGLYEEYLMRGYVLATLARGIGFWWGAIILSVAFGSMHLSNAGESPVGIFSAGAIGLVFCVSLWYLKSLWWAIGFHAGWDWAQSYFWGTADSGLVSKGHLLGVQPQGNILWSGGTTGPEGSLLVVVVIVAVVLLMWIVWRNKRTVAPPAEAAQP